MRNLLLITKTLLGWAFLLAAAAVTGADLIAWGFDGDIMWRDLGRLWFELDHGSLNLTQAIIQRYLHPALFDQILLPLMLRPAALVFSGFALLFLLLARLLRRRG